MGQTTEHAKTDELFKNPLHLYTKALLKSVPTIDLSARNKDKVILKGEVSSPINPKEGCRFAPRCECACDKCKNKMQLKDVGNEHYVACALYE